MISPINSTSLGKVLLVNIPYAIYKDNIEGVLQDDEEYGELYNNVTIEIIKDSYTYYSYSAIATYTSPRKSEYLKSIGVYPMGNEEISLLVAKSKLANRHLSKVILDEVETLLSK